LEQATCFAVERNSALEKQKNILTVIKWNLYRPTLRVYILYYFQKCYKILATSQLRRYTLSARPGYAATIQSDF
jgi:hypothetical protein